MKSYLTIFLMAASLVSCASKKVEPPPSDINWEMHELVPMEEPLACVKKYDFIELTRRLHRCESPGVKP
jgi:hypothetical protein